jgi:hypothetical protein
MALTGLDLLFNMILFLVGEMALEASPPYGTVKSDLERVYSSHMCPVLVI